MKKNRWAFAAIGVMICLSAFFLYGMNVWKNNVTIEEEEVALNSGAYNTPGKENAKEINTERTVPYTESVMNDASALVYTHSGDDYKYAITAEGKEVFAIRTVDGGYIDTFSGGGVYQTVDGVSGAYVYPIGVSEYEELSVDGQDAIKISYDMSDGSTAYNRYVFYDNHVRVEAYLQDIPNSSTVAGAILHREFVNTYIDAEKKTTADWVFPENGDFPYKEADSIVTSYHFDKNHRVYSFVRGETGKKAVLFEEYGQVDIPITIDNTVNAYSIIYDLVFENAASEKDADYIALFEGKNSDFAAGITSQTKRDSKATIYDVHSLDFNFNVTNLEKCEINTQVDFTIYDYYGNMLAKQSNSYALVTGTDLNIPVHIESAETGIMFIDFNVSSGQSNYREFYSFVVLDDYNYTGNVTSPFGLSGVRVGEYEPNDDTVWILENIGAANVRVCISEPDYVAASNDLLVEYLSKMTQKGIKINGQYLLMDGWVTPTAFTAAQYEEEIGRTLSEVGQYLNMCQVGNEYNLTYSYLDSATAMTSYIDTFFNPGYNSIKLRNQLDIASASVALSQGSWLEQLVTSGVYAKEDILATHAYGFPYSPDFSADSNIELVVEGSYARTRNFLDTYGDKTWHVDEVGYPTTANNTAGIASGCDLRSQADYTVREVILALKYGADVVQVYNLYDQPNLFKGVSPDNQEFNFGLFYYEDYYGRIMPKPSAMAYAVMTRQLDNVKACREIETESETVRAFEFTLNESDEKVVVAWSTCYHITNDVGYDFIRTPNLPWNNQWKQTETVSLALESDTVEIIDLMGNYESVQGTEDGKVQVTLDGSPLYIRCK